MNSGITAMASMAPSNPPKVHDSTADLSWAAAAPSGDPDHDLAEFSRSLAVPEQRAAQLEAGTGGSGGRPRKNLRGVDPDALTRAVDAKAGRRLIALVRGVRAYHNHPGRRALAEPPCV